MVEVVKRERKKVESCHIDQQQYTPPLYSLFSLTERMYSTFVFPADLFGTADGHSNQMSWSIGISFFNLLVFVLSADARRRSFRRYGQIDARIQIAGDIQTFYGRAGISLVPVEESCRGWII